MKETTKEMDMGMRPASRMNKRAGFRPWVKVLLLAAIIAAAFFTVFYLGCAVGHADPNNTTDEVCGAFNLGVPPSEIPGRLHANDGRENYWKAQRDTIWPIIEGQCG